MLYSYRKQKNNTMYKYVIVLILFIILPAICMQQTSLNVLEKEFLAAASEGSQKKIKRFLKKGISINTCNERNENALYWAARCSHWHLAKFLMEEGINLNCHPNNTNGNNTTYLHLVSLNSSYSTEDHAITYFLLNYALTHGANPNPLDKYGDTPLDKASQYKNYANRNLLKEFGGFAMVKDGEQCEKLS